ncbi:hypothetical protein I8H89_00380 [Candidatus Saccharibacteria bacterium]|nr:hypothetical protein [Candidatus Saccharibacteria bacterium]
MDNTTTNWNDIRDPDGEVQILATFAQVKGHYDPAEVQALIDEKGIRNAVKEINAELAPLIGVSPLFLTNVDGRKTLDESLLVK